MINHFTVSFVAGEELNRRIDEGLAKRGKTEDDIISIVVKSWSLRAPSEFLKRTTEDELYIFYK